MVSDHSKKASQWGAFFITAFVFALFTGPSQAQNCLAQRIDEQAVVTRVVDGDTLGLEDGRRLRLIGVNTPELGREGRADEPMAVEARDALQALLGSNSRVGLQYDLERKDRHGRSLARVFLADGRSIGSLLLARGLAASIVVPPNTDHATCYLSVENLARKAGLGVWAKLYRPVAVKDLSSEVQGFRLIQGRIMRVGESRHSIWLNFTRLPQEGYQDEQSLSVALRISRKDLPYFRAWSPQELLGKEIEARGWIYFSKRQDKQQTVMQLRHPAMLSILSQ